MTTRTRTHTTAQPALGFVYTPSRDNQAYAIAAGLVPSDTLPGGTTTDGDALEDKHLKWRIDGKTGFVQRSRRRGSGALHWQVVACCSSRGCYPAISKNGLVTRPSCF